MLHEANAGAKALPLPALKAAARVFLQSTVAPKSACAAVDAIMRHLRTFFEDGLTRRGER